MRKVTNKVEQGLTVMVMELSSKWWWLVASSVFMAWSSAFGEGDTPKAIPTKAGAAICTLSKTLKDVTPWATQQVEEGAAKVTHLEMKLLEWQTKWVQSKAQDKGSETCKMTGFLFRQVRKEIDKVREEVERLEREASKAAAFAANSAGRLDEFITVFANAQGSSKYCLGSDKAATTGELRDCFSGTDFSEESLIDIGERASAQEPNLFSRIESIKYSKMISHFTAGSGGGCNLVKGASGGILGKANLEKYLWWGGGILTIGAGFGGELSSTNLIAGEISNATNSKAFWTADPAQQIVHLKNASDAFKAFKAVQEAIQDKVKSIEDKIQSCMGGQEPGENNTEQNATEQTQTSPTCFDNVAKIAADLKEKRALLARYQKVKGWIPPSSASHPTTQFLGLLLTLL
ncbi:Transferrin receptor-like, ESAG6-like [Trypanosoma congolense IL3000]|uniref:Transferrin receptor-like, ESAG6-like n=1 Tax=Trypanosoma congolense (strain IL3000) TaxID=1068625 RepID=F9W8N7_TRYCI|nr:Transferrin receptor-like, ESAG6-like [Trypanosoma congolense IL3000]